MNRKIACHTSLWDPEDWESALNAIAIAGFAGVEGLDALYRDYAEKVALARRFLTQRNLSFIALTGRGDLVIPDKREEILRENLRRAEFLQCMGAHHLLLETGVRQNVQNTRQDFRAIAELLNELGKRCWDYDVHLCLLPRLGDRIQNEEEIDRIMNEVDTREVFLGLDTAHLLSLERNPAQIIKTYGDCVRHVYFCDVLRPVLSRDPAERVEDRKFFPPGAGIIDFAEIVNELKSLNYPGWISVKFDRGEEDPGLETQQAYEYIHQLVHPEDET